MARFADDGQTLLRGSDRGVATQPLEVAVRQGALAIETAPLLAAPSLLHDLQALLCSDLLDRLDSKRKAVVARWQKAARASRDLACRITAPFLDRQVMVSANTDGRADDADQ